jgi:prepilin-type N-terminal cleavage/methylation domain-containing protein
MKTPSILKKSGFTLLETVIAIGVLAVLLTGFLAVFGPAATGIRRAINVQEADRLTSTLERELVAVRSGGSGDQPATGFEKAYNWIESSYNPDEAIFVYQYRGDPGNQRPDGTLAPVQRIQGNPGKDYVVQPVSRRLSDPLFFDDLRAVEGGVFLVKCLQLTYNDSGDEMEAKSSGKGTITSTSGGGGGTFESYPDAVIAFAAEFHSMPAKTPDFFKSPGFKARFEKSNSPVFVRNLAVRR